MTQDRTRDRPNNNARAQSDGTSTLDLSGRHVGSSYILQRPIGQGATGTVWRGTDLASGRPVAIKLLHESLLRQPKLVTRFVQERTILLMLRHRNVVRVRDLFSVGETLGLVMDLVSGGSLRDHLREHRTVPAGEAARLSAQVAAALAEAHELGVVHRDLKPDNILLQTEDGRLETRLTDFGVARILNTPSMTTPNAVVGTPHYMSPEAFHSPSTSPATDVYALGVVLYELVTGRPPYDSDSIPDLMRRHMDGRPERPPGIPEPCWDVIMACMALKPRLRPSAAELVADLSDISGQITEVAALPAPTGRPIEPNPPVGPISLRPSSSITPVASSAAPAWPPVAPAASSAAPAWPPVAPAASSAAPAWPPAAPAGSSAAPAGSSGAFGRSSVLPASPAGAAAPPAGAAARSSAGSAWPAPAPASPSAVPGSPAATPNSASGGPGSRSGGPGSPSGAAGSPSGAAGSPSGASGPPSIVPDSPEPKQRRNQVPNWRWARPGATMTVIAVAMLASAVATTAWNLGRDDDDARAATATTVASQVPVAPVAGRTAAHRSAPRALPSHPHPAGTVGSFAPTTSPRATVRPSHRPATHHKARPRQPEAQPYGPWQCSQGFAFDLGTKTPLAPKPCQMLGRDIRYQASLTAPGGATGSISISLQDAGSGSIVAGPKTCDGLTFTGDAGTASCGPAPASPPRGHQYAVVMAYRYIRAGEALTSTAKGTAFAW